MTPKDADKFDVILSRLFRTMGKPVPDPDVKRAWWDVFVRFSLEEFATACANYVCAEDRAPVPAAVRRYIPRQIGAQQLMTYRRAQNGTGQLKRAVTLLRECKRRLEHESLPDKSKPIMKTRIIDGRAAVLALGKKKQEVIL